MNTRISIRDALDILSDARGIVEQIQDRFGFHLHEERLHSTEPLNAVKEALKWHLDERRNGS